MTLVAVNYHYVRPVFDLPHPGIHGITPTQFERQLQLLGQGGEFVSGEQICEAITGGRPLPERAWVITFDDGLREQAEHAWPVLERLGIPAIFFVNTRPIAEKRVEAVHRIHLLRAHTAPAEFLANFERALAALGHELGGSVTAEQAIAHYKYDDADTARLKFLLNFTLDRELRDAAIAIMFAKQVPGREAETSETLYMSVEQIRRLGERGCIGSHAHEHLPLGLLPPDQIIWQVLMAQSHLSEWTGRAPRCFSYPYGSREACSAHVAAVLHGAGVQFAFTMQRAANRDLRTPLHLARFDNNDVPGGKAARWTIEEFFDRVEAATWGTDL